MSRRKRDRRKSMSVGATAASAPAESGREPGRFSARRKTETMLRLLRGESLDSLARELGVLRAKVGEITMNNEVLLERCHRLEANLPLPRRRPSE
jgi:hypothetical protein